MNYDEVERCCIMRNIVWLQAMSISVPRSVSISVEFLGTLPNNIIQCALNWTIFEMTQLKMSRGTYDPFWLISRLNTVHYGKKARLILHIKIVCHWLFHLHLCNDYLKTSWSFVASLKNMFGRSWKYIKQCKIKDYKLF